MTYDISLIYGYNVGMEISSADSNCDAYACTISSGCVSINLIGMAAMAPLLSFPISLCPGQEVPPVSALAAHPLLDVKAAPFRQAEAAVCITRAQDPTVPSIMTLARTPMRE